MHRHAMSVVMTWSAAVCLLLGPRGALAQDSGASAEDRGPRFLLATAFQRTVPVDVSRAPVLGRRLTLELDGVPLKAALAAITAQAGLRLAYADDVLPLQRQVRLRAEGITAAAALTDVLFDVGVDVVFKADGSAALVRRPPPMPKVLNGAVVGRVVDARTQTPIVGASVGIDALRRSATTGSDGRFRITDVAPGSHTVRARYVGYTPKTVDVTVGEGQEATVDIALEKSAQRLDEVVTTGTLIPTETKAVPSAMSIVTGEDLKAQGVQRVDQIFRGQVPGVVGVDQGANEDVVSIYVRGANSFSSTPTIKTYVDGIEVSDPLFVTLLDPNSIDRIEILRGPQASTLYGSGAIEGVMQIFTKKGDLGLSHPQVSLTAGVGSMTGIQGQSTALRTDDAASVSGGNQTASYSLRGFYRHTGEWVPAYGSHDWGASAGGQVRQGALTLSSTLQYTEKSFTDAWNQDLAMIPAFSAPNNNLNHDRETTLGVTAAVQATPRWQHTLTLGYDQEYTSAWQFQPSHKTPDDTLLSGYDIHETRTSLFYHNDLQVPLGGHLGAVLTTGINHDWFDQTFGAGSGTVVIGSLGDAGYYRVPYGTTGYFTQAQLNVAERLFLTGGLRADDDPNFGDGFGLAYSPRAGVAYVQPVGRAQLKLRAAYGASIRAPSFGDKVDVKSSFYHQLANPDLGPERQHGIDGAVELYRGAASLSIGYYNQHVTDLIDAVPLTTTDSTGVLQIRNENIAGVKNEGWEFEAQVPIGPVQIHGTFSIMNSTVEAVAPSLGGFYQVGDRLFGPPHTLGGVSVGYRVTPTTAINIGMTYLGTIKSFDGIAEDRAFAGLEPFRRDYTLYLPTVTKFSVSATQELSKHLQLSLRSDNVGNNRRYERNNQYLATPRSIMVMMTAHN